MTGTNNSCNNTASTWTVGNLNLTTNTLKSNSGTMILQTDGTNAIQMYNGTSTLFSMTNGGIRTMPLQCAFFAYLASTVTNATGDGTNFIMGTSTALTISKDQNSNLNSNGTFTAPVKGIYNFSCYFDVGNLGVSTGTLVLLRATGIDYYLNATTASALANPVTSSLILGGLATIPLNAGDTCKAVIAISGTTKTVSIVGASSPIVTYFSGYLVC